MSTAHSVIDPVELYSFVQLSLCSIPSCPVELPVSLYFIRLAFDIESVTQKHHFHQPQLH